MAVESSPAGAMRDTMREPTRELMRETYPAAELFQKAHARMVMLHRLDEQLAALAEQRRKHEQELSIIQGQINEAFSQVLRPSTERRELEPPASVAPANSDPIPTAEAPAPHPEAAAAIETPKVRKKSDKTMAAPAKTLTPNIDPAWLRPQSEKQAAAVLADEDDD